MIFRVNQTRIDFLLKYFLKLKKMSYVIALLFLQTLSVYFFFRVHVIDLKQVIQLILNLRCDIYIGRYW